MTELYLLYNNSLNCTHYVTENIHFHGGYVFLLNLHSLLFTKL
jgi:hypothetical protein